MILLEAFLTLTHGWRGVLVQRRLRSRAQPRKGRAPDGSGGSKAVSAALARSTRRLTAAVTDHEDLIVRGLAEPRGGYTVRGRSNLFCGLAGPFGQLRVDEVGRVIKLWAWNTLSEHPLQSGTSPGEGSGGEPEYNNSYCGSLILPAS